jgi:hypothetical protein
LWRPETGIWIVSVSPYSADAILATVEAWADAVPALA